jgi:predicted signal transduction protein with EAL and GGDEF domain
LEIITTAQGVETKEQLELVRAAGCTQAQGYLFGRPCAVWDLNFDVMIDWAPDNKKRRTAHRPGYHAAKKEFLAHLIPIPEAVTRLSTIACLM